MRRYNANAKTSLTVNTGYVKEELAFSLKLNVQKTP